MGNVKHSFVAQSINSGVVFAGPTGGLELPTLDDIQAPSVPWKALDLGTLSENGLSIAYTRSSNKVKDFDGAPYITVQEDFADGFKATFLDVGNERLQKVVFGDAKVTTTAATISHGEQRTILHSSDQLPFLQAAVWVRSGEKRKLYVAEICQVSEVAEIVDIYNDATKYELTFDVLRGTDGAFLKQYEDDGVKLVGS